MSQYTRSISENYGASTVELVELPMTDDIFTELNVDSKKVLLPVLNMKKYDSNCHCYAIIERLKMSNVTMVDMLYSYQELSLDDANFRDYFMRTFSRRNINSLSMMPPGIILNPVKQSEKEAFTTAINRSIVENNGRKIFLTRTYKKENIKVNNLSKPKKKQKRDGIILEVIKKFYESISNKRNSKKTDKDADKVEYSVNKEVAFLKNGEIITGNVQSGKYLSKYKTTSAISKKVDNIETGTIKDIMSVYITGVDDKLLMTTPNYFKKFEDIVLSSNVLESLSYVNPNKIPMFLYAGELSIGDERMKENLAVENYIDEINQVLFLSKEYDVDNSYR